MNKKQEEDEQQEMGMGELLKFFDINHTIRV
jgi:hypothetical protein